MKSWSAAKPLKSQSIWIVEVNKNIHGACAQGPIETILGDPVVEDKTLD
jgi:hypothetical protein